MRRFSNRFAKRDEMLRDATDLTLWYAMELKVTERLWSPEHILRIVDEWEAHQKANL